jgi:O6-methylguanine-DNA--protein-cysteine methyltransferase
LLSQAVVNFALHCSVQYLDLLGDDTLEDIQTEFARRQGVPLEELQLSAAVSERMVNLGDRMLCGEVVTRDQMFEALNETAEANGAVYGVPVPSIGTNDSGTNLNYHNYLVVARGVPLGLTVTVNGLAERRARTEAEMNIGETLRANTRNSWQTLGDQSVCVVDTENGPMAWIEPDAGVRLRKLMSGMTVRMGSHLTVEAELKAQELLKSKINEAQWRCYVLNDLFLESSPRSDLKYIFRKGKPTLALSFHGAAAKQGRVIAALCLHPMGYYQYTHAGLMAPTDEVVAHLVMMRADEHFFWKKSGQWNAWDTRSGL